MPFHIRLVNRTNPAMARTVAEQPTRSAVLTEFLQGMAYGFGVALVALAAFWLVRTNGLGL